MTDPLGGCRAKVRWAAQHLESLYDEVRAFSNSEPKPLRFVQEVDKERSRYVVRVRIERDPPIEWSLRVGDVVHNLRSALDHLIWQLVLRNGKTPRGTQFPIFDQRPVKPGDVERWNRMIAGVSDEAERFIAACQPYQGTDGRDAHTLAGIRDLSNEDKHRVLVSSYTAIQAAPHLIQIDVIASRDVAQVNTGQVFAGRALEDGDPVVEAAITITGPDPQVQTKADLPLDIGFGGRNIVPLEGLKQMCESVAGTIREAEIAFFS